MTEEKEQKSRQTYSLFANTSLDFCHMASPSISPLKMQNFKAVSKYKREHKLKMIKAFNDEAHRHSTLIQA